MRRLLLAGFLALAALYLPVSLLWPMGRDQGIFAWAGDVICRGGVPYRDAWEQKGPAAHYTYAAAQRLFGHHQWAVRVFDYVFVAAGAAGAWLLAARWRRDERNPANPASIAGVTAAVLFWLWYGGIGYWSTAQPDGWIAVLQVLAVAAVATLPRAGPAAAGFLVGICCLYKPHYGIFLPALLPPLWCKPTVSTALRLRKTVTMAAAFCLPLALTAAWFWHRGALRDLFQCLFVFNWEAHLAAEPLSAGQAIHRLGEFFFSVVPDYWDPRVAPAFPLVVLGFCSIWRNARPWFWTALAWLALDLAAVVAQGKYFGYHWKPLYGPLAVAAGVGAERARLWLLQTARPKFLPAPATRAAACLAILLLGLPLWRPMQARLTTCAQDLLVKHSWDAYYRRFGGYNSGHFSLRGEWEVADYLKAHTRPDDRVLVWGFDPSINFFADRQTPTRFGFNLPLTRDPPHPYQTAWRREFLDDLKRTPPAYVAVVDMDTNELMNKTSRQLLAEFPDFDRLLRENYAPETTIERYELWRRR